MALLGSSRLQQTVVEKCLSRHFAPLWDTLFGTQTGAEISNGRVVGATWA